MPPCFNQNNFFDRDCLNINFIMARKKFPFKNQLYKHISIRYKNSWQDKCGHLIAPNRVLRAILPQNLPQFSPSVPAQPVSHHCPIGANDYRCWKIPATLYVSSTDPLLMIVPTVPVSSRSTVEFVAAREVMPLILTLLVSASPRTVAGENDL